MEVPLVPRAKFHTLTEQMFYILLLLVEQVLLVLVQVLPLVLLEQLYQYLPTETGHTLLRFHPDHAGIEILQHYDTVKIQLVLARQLTEQIKREQERKQQDTV